jgi:hypothetical protein
VERWCQWEEEDMKQGYRVVNMMAILCTQAWKWKNETCWNCSRKKIKENGGGSDSTMIYCKNLCKGHNVPPVQKSKICKQYYEKQVTLRGGHI